MKNRVKTDAEIWVNSVRIEAHDTGFTLEVTGDPEQHKKYLSFYPEHAESILDAIKRYIDIRDSIRKLYY